MKLRAAHRKSVVLGGVAALVLAGAATYAWAQAQNTGTFATKYNSGRIKAAQLDRCDVSESLNGEDTPVGGRNDCTSGDWTRQFDCRGAETVTAYFFEYGGGSGRAKLWDCTHPVGDPNAVFTTRGTGISGISAPGNEDPAGSPSAADPDPLCVELTAGVTLDGTNTVKVNITDGGFSYLVGEIDDCTGNCDSTLEVLCTYDE